MPKRQSLGRQDAGAPPAEKVTMRLGPDGRFVAVREPRELTPETRADERPPEGEDPRPAAFRNVPPFGGAG